jgi:CobQ-like glutamine amidotransferase family enzyme
MSLTILSLRPDLLNVNGDAENARVLAVRAQWAGIDARVVTDTDELPSAVVIGSGYDGDLVEILASLRDRSALLTECIRSGVPILAVAMGLDLLGTRIERDPGEWLDGLGLVDGEAALTPTRVRGDLVVETEFGTLVGYENHSRSWTGSVSPLGRVVTGHGNDATGGQDGIRHLSIIGTHLHGPVLARNPAVADHILREASAGLYTGPGAAADTVDKLAAASRAKTLASR